MSDNRAMEDFILDRSDLEWRRVVCARKIDPKEREWAERYVGACRFNASKAAKLSGFSERQAWTLRDKPAVRAYAGALMAEAAAKLHLSRDNIIAEIGRVAFSDISMVMAEVVTTATQLIAERAAAAEGPTVAKNAKGTPRPALKECGPTHWFGPEIVARLGPSQAVAIRKVKFRTEWEVREIKNAKGKVVETIRTPVAVIDTLELHDKLAALNMLAPWFGLQDGSEVALDEGARSEWHGLKVIPAKTEEED